MRVFVHEVELLHVSLYYMLIKLRYIIIVYLVYVHTCINIVLFYFLSFAIYKSTGCLVKLNSFSQGEGIQLVSLYIRYIIQIN